MRRMQLQAALAAFQVQLSADDRSDHTKRQYARHVRALDAWLTKRGYTKNIAQLSPAVVAEFAASDDARNSDSPRLAKRCRPWNGGRSRKR